MTEKIRDEYYYLHLNNIISLRRGNTQIVIHIFCHISSGFAHSLLIYDWRIAEIFCVSEFRSARMLICIPRNSRVRRKPR